MWTGSAGRYSGQDHDSYNGDFNVLKNNLNNQMHRRGQRVVADARHAGQGERGGRGKLATRADASKHQGDYRRSCKAWTTRWTR